MDFVYTPEVAQLITEWVAYMSPVPAVQDLLADHAKTEKDPATAKALDGMANNKFLWPDEALLEKTPFGRNLTTEEERDEWDAIFVPLSES